MSDDNKNMEDAFDDAKDSAKKATGEATEKAKEFAKDAKEAASDFAEEAKETAKEFSDNAKEAFNTATGENKKLLAGILAILLGPFGIHKFILGYQKEGIIMLCCTFILGFITCGLGAGITGIIGLIEGIIYLTKSDEEFVEMYQTNKKPWF